MHWQFGGNLEPVQMICETDWKECPKAIANYVWSEIVTDVLDCLRNESIVWRMLAVLSVSVVLLRAIYSKLKRDEAAVDKDIVNKIGYKVEDLELKVNIMTYKLQYGNWPSPHQVQKTNFQKNLRNLRLTLSNPNNRNNWIKHVLLRENLQGSYPSYCPSEHRITELFAAKKRSVYPYLRQENLPVDHSSKSSKSTSDKSLKLTSIFKTLIDRKRRETSRHENLETQYRNAISLPVFSKRRACRCTRKTRRHLESSEAKNVTPVCKRFTRTMDDCKRYLKQLYDSNKNLGLICSSSEISNGSSVKNFWSDTQQQRYDRRRNLLDLTEEFRKDKENESGQGECPEEKKSSGNADRAKDDYSELLNAIYPILRLVDERLLPSNVSIKFYSDMFAKRSPSTTLTPAWHDRKKYVETSQEALYQVIKKLESLHNVLRAYQLDNVEARAPGREAAGSNRFGGVCQNKFASVTAKDDGWGKNRKNETKERSSSISSEQYESDDTGRSSIVSVQNYTNIFNAYPYCSLIGNPEPRTCSSKDRELGMIKNDQMIYSTSVKYGKVPERAYYTISSDSSAEKSVEKRRVSGNFASSPVVRVEDDVTNSFDFAERYPVPMETDEDVIVSPTSSRTEMSKDSELEDKPTAVLLQEALQFKKALLTRVELEKICFVQTERGEASDETAPDHGKCFYVNDDLRPKFLDIISEEQSVSSSTEKTSRTYMFFNLKQDQQFNGDVSSFIQQNDVRDSNANVRKKYLDSMHNLDSASEYFSFSNIIQGGDETDRDAAPVSGLQVKYLNDALNESDEKLPNFSSRLNATDVNERETGLDCTQEKESFREHFTRMDSINEFINRNINSVELFSQDLDDAPAEEKIGNLEQDRGFDFLRSEPLKRYANVTCAASPEDASNANDDQELSPHSPNLTLKRNPGACSLIEQPLMRTDERPKIILTEDPIYELSASESKGTSLETNLMQESLTSSINQSNDSNIPEPSSVTALIDKSLDEEKLNIDWLNEEDGFSDDCENRQNIKTYSANTIVLQKYDTRNLASCKENDALRNEKSKSVARDSFTKLSKRELIDEADFYKSYSNLVSAHSSMYFTDEGSASTTKLNDARPKALEEQTQSNLRKQQNKELRDAGNPEALSTSTSNDSKYINEFSSESKRSQRISTGKLDRLLTDKPIRNSKEESKSLVPRNDTGDHNLLPADITSDERPFVSPRNENHVILSNVSLRHNSLKEMKDERPNSTVKSRSHESYPSKLKRQSGLENVKGLKSDLLNSVQATSEDNSNTMHTKLRHLSAEPRRRNTDDNIKLDRKRSRSQVNFRTNEPSKDVNSKLQRSSLAANSNGESKLRGHLKSLSPTSRTSSKSCIPILKSRLEAARKAENESRPKSPLRGPLTMTMFYREGVCDKSQDASYETQVEGSKPNNVDKTHDVQRTSDDGNHKQESTRASHIERDSSKAMDSVVPQDQMVIYVNIFTKYDHNVTRIIDPNKFLEYVKNEKSSTQKLGGNRNGKDVEFPSVPATSEGNATQKIVTVVSSVIDGNELGRTTTNASGSKTQNVSLSKALLNGKLKNLCFLSVEHREIDVTAKPSVMDTSTSISDLENVSGTAKNKFQICGTPKELNNEEYTALLEILRQESNSVHLHELQNVCAKLSSARTKV